MTPSKTFNPTAAQIEAAQNLALAMAFQRTAKDIFHKIDTAILSSRDFHYSSEYSNDGKYSRMLPEMGIPEDRAITDPSDVHMMEGIMHYGKPEYAGSDAERYYNLLDMFAKKEGFVHGMNGLCRADNELMEAKTRFLVACENITGMSDEQLTHNWDIRTKVLDLTLSLFGPYLDGAKNKLRTYFDERIIETKTAA